MSPTLRPVRSSPAAAGLVLLALSLSPAAAAGTGEPCSLFGTKATAGDADLFYPLVTLSFSASPSFVDNGNGVFGAGEPAYVDADGSGAVTPSDVRLTGASGSVVVPGDTDIGAPLAVLPGGAGFVDADASQGYNGPDLVYWDTDSSVSVTVADLRLTPTLGGPAGTAVVLGDADMGDPMAVLPSQFAYFDADQDGLFTGADFAYLGPMGAFQVQPGHVRLSGAPTALAAEPVVSTTTGSVFLTPAFRATLTSGGAPVAGAAIGFYVGGDLLCSAPTDGAGQAACGSYFERFAATAAGGYEARFAGAFPHCGSSAAGPVQ